MTTPQPPELIANLFIPSSISSRLARGHRKMTFRLAEGDLSSKGMMIVFPQVEDAAPEGGSSQLAWLYLDRKIAAAEGDAFEITVGRTCDPLVMHEESGRSDPLLGVKVRGVIRESYDLAKDRY